MADEKLIHEMFRPFKSPPWASIDVLIGPGDAPIKEEEAAPKDDLMAGLEAMLGLAAEGKVEAAQAVPGLLDGEGDHDADEESD